MEKSGLRQFSEDKPDSAGSRDKKMEETAKTEPKLNQSGENVKTKDKKDKKKKKIDGADGSGNLTDKTTSSGSSDFENKVL